MIRGLFCGISEYRANQELPYCVNDAKKMKEIFTEIFMCSDDSINVLATEGHIDDSEYISEVKKFSETCTEDDVAVIYYSGHGGIDEDGYNYLYATNTYDGNTQSYIYFDVIVDRLNESRAKSKLVIVDCCHADSNYGSEQQRFDIDKALGYIYQSGITAIFSCRKEEESYPYYGKEISAFTQFFCDAARYKKIYQPEGLYLSDLKISIDAYARAWNMKNESMQQRPVLRSNVVGTIVLPLKTPPKISKREQQRVMCNTFDVLDFQWQVKKPKDYYQKVYMAKIVAKIDISNDNITEFSKIIIDTFRRLKLQAKSQKQQLTQDQLVDVVQLWIAKDYLDVEDSNFAYQVYWEKDDSLYWCKQLGDTRVQFGNMAYRKIQAYERQRNYREKYTLPDNEIKQFWTTNLKRLIVDTEKVIYEYSNLYLNNELPYERLKEKAKVTYCGLKDVYKDVFEAWWPLPDSDLKDYTKFSNELATDIQELLFLFDSDKGEEWVINNFKLKLERYYKSVEKWRKMTSDLEE